jgi:Cell cycle protein
MASLGFARMIGCSRAEVVRDKSSARPEASAISSSCHRARMHLIVPDRGDRRRAKRPAMSAVKAAGCVRAFGGRHGVRRRLRESLERRDSKSRFLRITNIAERANESYSSLVAFGLMGCWLVHIVVNVGMTLNLTPITGIPLPFFSYGGSFMLASWLAIGILMRISYEGREVPRTAAL